MTRPFEFRLAWLLVVTMGCGSVRAPQAASRAVPRPDPGGALVVFVLDRAPLNQGLGRPQARLDALPSAHPLMPGQGVDILDERGALLGRLVRGSWLAVSRPPGRATFYAVPTSWSDLCLGDCPDGDAQLGVMHAELEVGRRYSVWVGHVRTRVDLGEAVANRCRNWVSGDLLTGYWTRALDLIAIDAGRWPELAAIVENPTTRAMRPAPRGLKHPRYRSVLRHADARVDRCWSPLASTLRPEDGLSVAVPRN